tara:strand:+ start:1213 stop:2247 length:1035 start_codon:yes stop_codon:yes gene_type:complete
LSNKKSHIIFSPGVHTGGGLVLLKAALVNFPKNLPLILFLDIRISKLINIPENAKVFWINPNLFSRILFEWKLFRITTENTILLSFTSLPPLFRNKGYVIVFHQNSILLQDTTLKVFSKIKEFKFILKRLYSKIYKKNINEYIVQTPSMEVLLKKFYDSKINVRVIPFAENLSSTKLNDNRGGFLYIADGNAHKNHNNLLEAWSLLGKNGFKPKLFLTLSENDKLLLKKIEYLCLVEGLEIYNIDKNNRHDILDIYKSSEALIFPSLYESFGLPLIEASQMGLPILASELDYVREACDPVETFDPNSPKSIMKAVYRFIGKSYPKVKIESPISFLNEIGIDQKH